MKKKRTSLTEHITIAALVLGLLSILAIVAGMAVVMWTRILTGTL